MDIRMPIMDGLEATRRILSDQRCADARIIILTTFDLDEYVYSALRPGPAGSFSRTPLQRIYWLAYASLRRRGAAVPRHHPASHRVVPPAANRTQQPDASHLDVLTDRERDVLALVAKGLSNAEIGGRLYISPATVKTHVARILTKLDARDRAQLIVIAYETRLVRPGGT